MLLALGILAEKSPLIATVLRVKNRKIKREKTVWAVRWTRAFLPCLKLSSISSRCSFYFDLIRIGE
jgi:hypothetical protein